MLEKPNINDEKILRCLSVEYELTAARLDFLPLGADLNTAVYRAETTNGAAYFVKLRRGDVNPACVAVPRHLADLGMPQVIPPIPTRAGQLWSILPPYNVILSPFVHGRNAYERRLSEAQWIEFGAALKRFHTTPFPDAITAGVPREDFSPQWRQIVTQFLERIQHEQFSDPVARKMASFLRGKIRQTRRLVNRAEQLASTLRAQPPATILCHADIHGWNLLIDDDGRLFMVDWDTLMLASKERDLMFIGAGLGDSGFTSRQEETMFYRGYGKVEINRAALAYYRYERIIEDIAVICKQIFLSDAGGADRMMALGFLKSNFLAGNTIARALHADQQLGRSKRKMLAVPFQGLI